MPGAVSYNSLWYFLPDGVGEIEFLPAILEHFDRYRQQHPKDKEAGGQLFWQYAAEGHRQVASITGPRPTDQRSRVRYKADHRQEQMEIDCHYERDLYFLGDWHTHPERQAKPSDSDIEAIQEIYKTSRNPGPGLLLVIVGNGSVTDGLSVTWCNEKLQPVRRLAKI